MTDNIEFLSNAEPVKDTSKQYNIPLDHYLQGQLPQQATNLLNQKDFLEVLKHYTEDDMIPKEVTTSKWSIFGKGLQLTFLEEKDLPIIDVFNNVLRIDTLMSMPSHLLTFEHSHQMDQTQLYMFIQAKRAIGTTQGKVNERTLQVTQIAQSINTQSISGQQKSSNMMAKLRSIF